METSQVRRAVAAAHSTATELGLQVTDTVIIHNSDRIALRLIPCDVLVRIAPQAWEDSFQFEADVARLLTAIDSPIGELAAGVEPRVYVCDTFALTFWTYYDHVGDIAPTAYADALMRMHAGLRQITFAAPHITERFGAWVEEVNNQEQTPDLPEPGRGLLRTTFNYVRNTMSRYPTSDQLLHGEPHPGNLLNTPIGPLFIDLQTCQRGPVEYDIAFLPEEAAIQYPGANQHLVHLFRILMWAGFTTMRWRRWDQFPNQDYWRIEGFNRLRAALNRA